MRIKGPNGVDGAGEVDQVANVDRPDAVGEIGEVEAPRAAKESGSADAISQVATQLRNGEISVDQAVDRLIDDAIARQLGSQKELEPKLRELLRSYAENDPFLAARIRRLTVAK
jgi:hypothetical protein